MMIKRYGLLPLSVFCGLSLKIALAADIPPQPDVPPSMAAPGTIEGAVPSDDYTRLLFAAVPPNHIVIVNWTTVTVNIALGHPDGLTSHALLGGQEFEDANCYAPYKAEIKTAGKLDNEELQCGQIYKVYFSSNESQFKLDVFKQVDIANRLQDSPNSAAMLDRSVGVIVRDPVRALKCIFNAC